MQTGTTIHPLVTLLLLLIPICGALVLLITALNGQRVSTKDLTRRRDDMFYKLPDSRAPRIVNHYEDKHECPECLELVDYPGYVAFRCSNCGYAQPSKKDMFPNL